MKRKLGICTVISFVFAGLSAPAFLFSVSVYFLAVYCIGESPTGGGSPAVAPSIVLSLICLVAAVAAIASVVVFAVRIVKTRTRKSRVFYMAGCFAIAVLGTIIANVTQQADLFLLWKGCDRHERDRQYSILAAVFNGPDGRRHPCDTWCGIA